MSSTKVGLASRSSSPRWRARLRQATAGSLRVHARAKAGKRAILAHACGRVFFTALSFAPDGRAAGPCVCAASGALVTRTTRVRTGRRCVAGARMPGERTSAHLRGIGYGSRGCSSGSRYPCPSHTTRSWAACTCATHSGDPSLFTSPPSAGLCCRSSQPGNRCPSPSTAGCSAECSTSRS